MKETRYIDCEKVRQLCIKHRFYTVGTCAQYENMLRMCDKYDEPTIDDFKRIATDILIHSALLYDVDRVDMTFERQVVYIMELLVNYGCTSYFR